MWTILATLTIAVGFLALGTQTSLTKGLLNLFNEKTAYNGVPVHVLYNQLFNTAVVFRQNAQMQESNGEPVTQFSTYFKDEMKLSDEESKNFEEAAFRFSREVQAIDTQLGNSILEFQNSFSGGKLPKNFTIPTEILELERQKENLALIHRDQLSQSLGDETYEKINDFVRGDFAQSFQAFPLSSTDRESKEDGNLSPDEWGCAGNIYGGSTTTINSTQRKVEGYSTSYLDAAAGLCEHPRVLGELYRTDLNETPLDARIHTGNRNYVAAQVFLASFNYVVGKTYCTYGTHFIVNVNNSNQVVLKGRSSNCKTITFQPTPTPTPVCPAFSENGLPNCPSPTPTPTPTPTPPNPTVQVTEVGFKADHKITRLADGTVIDPSDDQPTWVRGRPNNNKFIVAYTKGINPQVFAKFTISPAPSQPINAKIRVKKGSTILTPSSNISITLNSATATVTDVPITYNNLESEVTVKHEDYDFDWEISFDNQSWRSIGSSGKHEIHWLWDTPIQPAFLNAAAHETTNPTSGTYTALYDVALENTTGKIGRGRGTIDKVIEKVNSDLADKVNYKPNYDSTTGNPLEILTQNRPGAVCRDNALILYGLLRSIGIDPSIKYHWGGDTRKNSSTPNRRHFYKYPRATNDTVAVTMRVSRNQLGTTQCTSDTDPSECVEPNPHFKYHATVGFTYTENSQTRSVSYDPSYGKKENEVKLTEAADENGVLKKNDAATAYRVTRDKFSPFTSVDFTTMCPHRYGFNSVPVTPPSNFNSERSTDFAVLTRFQGYSDWMIKVNSLDSEVKNISLVFDPGDTIAPADYDGDGIIDPTIWRPDGIWLSHLSTTDEVYTVVLQPKNTDDKPVPGDYDGDGKADIASWRSSDGTWFVHRSSTDQVTTFQWGMAGDIPVPGDYDGDNKTDYGVWRPSNGTWYIFSSVSQSWISPQFGMSGDIPVIGDYNGDGQTDFAVVRPSNGVWYILESAEYTVLYRQGEILGANDKPVPGDYDGDGRTDVATWRNSDAKWIIIGSRDGEAISETWGIEGDIPIPSAYVYR